MTFANAAPFKYIGVIRPEIPCTKIKSKMILVIVPINAITIGVYVFCRPLNTPNTAKV